MSDPIIEIALGDLDGDSLEELAVLEESSEDNAEYLTVWRWHGWGFSLVWRSPIDRYSDVVLVSEGASQLIIQAAAKLVRPPTITGRHTQI